MRYDFRPFSADFVHFFVLIFPIHTLFVGLHNLPAFSPCDCMQIGVEAVVKVCVWLPDLLQHLHVEAQLVDHQVVRVLLQPLQEIIKEFVQTQ